MKGGNCPMSKSFFDDKKQALFSVLFILLFTIVVDVLFVLLGLNYNLNKMIVVIISLFLLAIGIIAALLFYLAKNGDNSLSLWQKVKRFIVFWWEKEAIRFLFAGAINTIVGIILSFIFRDILFEKVFNWNPKLIILQSPIVIEFDYPYLIAFVLGLPIAYTTQTIMAFRAPWKWERFLRYPLSSIPNFLMQELGILIFESWIGWSHNIAYILGTILPLPIMFFIIRFLVKPKKKENTLDNQSEVNQ